MVYHYDCRLFTGYKPCQYKRDCQDCPHYDPVKERVAIVSLEALGAVLRSTCLLLAIKRRFPESHITWFTLKNAKPLLDNNPLIDRIITLDGKTQSLLDHLKFDVVYAVDKSMEAGALAERMQAHQKYGFGLDQNGVIRPLSPEADYQYAVGLDDQLKFFVNQKPETQQITETMGLEWQRDPYVLELSAVEKTQVLQRRQSILQDRAKGIIGFNTGCSLLFPYKKFTVERSIEVIRAWREQHPDWAVALLGGPEDTTRQAQMKAAFADDPLVVNTPTDEGLRSGILWMNTADLVLSGCSLGLHIAIGLGKPAIAWFGVSCIQEIDLYDRGMKLQAEVTCSPCWKKSCDQKVKCYDMVRVESIMQATQELIEGGEVLESV
jgi:heptosyltransferase-2